MIMRFTDYKMRPIGFLHDHEKKESPREKYLKDFKAFKSKRKPYSKDEDKEIIKWILKNQSFNDSASNGRSRLQDLQADVKNQNKSNPSLFGVNKDQCQANGLLV